MVRRDDTWCSHVEVVAHDVLESLRVAVELERELAQRQLRPERLPDISAGGQKNKKKWRVKP
jgi:hypothetical protein